MIKWTFSSIMFVLQTGGDFWYTQPSFIFLSILKHFRSAKTDVQLWFYFIFYVLSTIILFVRLFFSVKVGSAELRLRASSSIFPWHVHIHTPLWGYLKLEEVLEWNTWNSLWWLSMGRWGSSNWEWCQIILIFCSIFSFKGDCKNVKFT